MRRAGTQCHGNVGWAVGFSDPYEVGPASPGNLVIVPFDRITLDPAQMGGLPCIRGLRIPVTTVIGQLAAGRSYGEVLKDFPELEREDILAALEYAAAAVQERELPICTPV